MSIGKTISSACVVTWFNPQALIDGTMMLGGFSRFSPTDRVRSVYNRCIGGVRHLVYGAYAGNIYL